MTTAPASTAALALAALVAASASSRFRTFSSNTETVDEPSSFTAKTSAPKEVYIG